MFFGGLTKAFYKINSIFTMKIIFFFTFFVISSQYLLKKQISLNHMKKKAVKKVIRFV